MQTCARLLFFLFFFADSEKGDKEKQQKSKCNYDLYMSVIY